MNGLADGAVHILKKGLRKLKQGTLEYKLARFLFHYRLTPQSTTGVSPEELLMGRRLRIKTRLDAIFPKPENQVTKHQEKQWLKNDVGTQTREFTEGERINVKFFGEEIGDGKQERFFNAWGHWMTFCLQHPPHQQPH